MNAGKVLLLLIALLFRTSLVGQEPVERPEERDRAEAIRSTQQTHDLEMQISPEDRAQINRRGITDEQFLEERRHDAVVEEESRRAYANGGKVLNTTSSVGWAYAESGGERGRPTSPDYSHPDATYGINFTLVRDLPLSIAQIRSRLDQPPISKTPRIDITSLGRPGHDRAKSLQGNLIFADSQLDVLNLDLEPFFQINNQLLEDFPEYQPKLNQQASQTAHQPFPGSEALAISVAQTSRGYSLITTYDLRDSASSGTLHGSVQLVKESGNDALEGSIKFSIGESSSRTRRVFLYGDAPVVSAIEQLAADKHYQLIRRTSAPRALSQVNLKLDSLSSHNILSTRVAVANGLPRSADVLEQMSPFLGVPGPWIQFNDQLSAFLSVLPHSEVDNPADFREELLHGKSDVLLLFAHSSGGITLFLGKERLDVKDIERTFPARDETKRAPRLAILFSCGTGKAPRQTKSLFFVGHKSAEDRIAQVLLKKGYFDRIIAPNRDISPNESLQFLLRLLNGETEFPTDPKWINWAFDVRNWRDRG